jgi:hypothetical protein
MRDGGPACLYTNGNSDLPGAELAYNLIADTRAAPAQADEGPDQCTTRMGEKRRRIPLR